jgi:hypothetical protein
MSWSTAAAHYLVRLPRVFDVQRHALSLAQLPQARVAEELRQELVRPVEPLRRQYERLKKDEFRIAVVGLEKAGKSTFVNAWLGADLLPNEMKRCTFTTTQLYSVDDPSEQRLEVYPKSRDQFERMVSELENRARSRDSDDARRAASDLEVISRNRRTLDEVLADEMQRYSFTRLDDIGAQLKKYVADESFGHAVLETRLYISGLATARGIVFYDVPGLNSGLAKQVEESEQMLKDCDAVILIQSSKRPNLEAHEQKLLQFVQAGDEVIGIAGKLFVFLGRIDEQGTAEALEQAKSIALRDWQARGELPPSRLIPGSAAAYLLLIHSAGENLLRETGGLAVVRPALERVTCAGSDEELKRASGIPLIKERIETYLQHERIDILHRRCREPMGEILAAAQRIFEQVRQRFPEDPEEARRVEENRRGIGFSEWWKKHRWLEVRAELNRSLEGRILRPSSPGSEAGERSIDTFRRRYRQEIEKQVRALPSRRPELWQRLIEAYSPAHNEDPMRFNLEWRERLFEELRGLIDRVSRELALELKTEADALLERMTALLWGSKEVAARLREERPGWQSELEGKLQTLFLRFARPVVAVLARSPLASVNRHEQVKRLAADIELLDNYYPLDKEPAYSRLQLFARYGRELLTNKALRRKVLGAEDAAEGASGQDSSSVTQESRSNTDVVEEVEADLKALEVYLLDAVYAAAGFEGFYEEELRGLCDWFVGQEGAWAGVARNEHLAGNTLLLRDVPDELRGQSHDTEVSERLRQLRIALEEARKSEG